MSVGSDSIRLFEDFPPVSTEEWEKKIREDLKDGDYDDTLLWRLADEITLRPYYRSEDVEPLQHVRPDGPTVQLDCQWRIQQNIATNTLADAADRVREAVEGGVHRIGLVLQSSDPRSGDRHAKGIHTPTAVPVQRLDDMERVLGAVPLENVGIHLDGGPKSLRHFRLLLETAKRRTADLDTLRGSVGFDPIAHLARTGFLAREAFESAARVVDELGDAAPGFRLFEAGTRAYHNGGASVVQEAALATAAVAEYLDQFQKLGLDPRDVLRRLFVTVAASASFFPEVAKLRALRLLIAQVADAFGIDVAETEIPIHVQTSLRSMTLYGAHTNLVRATTEAAAAVIGGCEVLIVQPFDAVEGDAGPFSMRLARNIQHLLRYEANFDRVDEPAAGSYYCEVLTDAVARRAWKEFQAIEQEGGLLKALESGYVQKQLRVSRHRLELDVATRRRVLVGTNRYAEPSSMKTDASSGETVPIPPVTPPETAGDTDGGERGGMPGWKADPIDGFREAEPIERIRSRFEALDQRPSARILPIGSPATRSARAKLAADVLACGGIVGEIMPGCNTWAEALEAASPFGEEGAPDLLIVAAPDDAYSSAVIDDIRSAYRSSTLGIVVSDDVIHQADFAMGRLVNVPELLGRIHDTLGLA